MLDFVAYGVTQYRDLLTVVHECGRNLILSAIYRLSDRPTG